MHSALSDGSVGKNSPNFSAKYTNIAPDSKTRVEGSVLVSKRAGIFELGFISTKPLPNWEPSPIFIKKALPLTILTIIGYILSILVLNNYNELNETIYQVIFIGLASLTFPHILLEYLIEKNERK